MEEARLAGAGAERGGRATRRGAGDGGPPLLLDGRAQRRPETGDGKGQRSRIWRHRRRPPQGNTGHAETVKLSFDENILSYENILELFFKMHDPTQKDMQFPDVGTQYRSEIFYENEQQREIANKVKEKFNKVYNNKIETNISPIKNY